MPEKKEFVPVLNSDDPRFGGSGFGDRNQAQGLVNLLTAGVGVFASNFLFDAVLSRGVAPGAHNWPVAYVVAIALSSIAFVAVAAGFKTRK